MLTIEGAASVEKSLRRLIEQIPDRAAQTLNAVAEETMTVSKDRTPVKTGRLKRSGNVSKHATAEDLSAELSYGTEYAVHVHERLDLRHTVGQAKFLESAVNEAVKVLGPRVAEDLLR